MPAAIATEIFAPPTIPLHRLLEAPAARASLRAQIARLEGKLGALAVTLWDSGRGLPPALAAASVAPSSSARACDRTASSGSARLLTLGELEAVRDDLVSQVRAAERELERCADDQANARTRLEAMLADPNTHRFEVVHRAELGERGCGAYHVRPRLGLLGMLFDWWCVKLSSGCP